MPARLITPPETEPITLEEAKAHLRVDFDDDNDQIELLLKAARQRAEKFLGLALHDQVWDVYLDEFPDDNEPIRIIPSPVIEVVDLFYGGPSAEQTFGASSYYTDAAKLPNRISLASGGSWPTVTAAPNVVRARVRVGLVDTQSSPVSGEVHADILAAIILYLKADYSPEDEAAGRLRAAAENILSMHRIHTGMA